MFGLAPRTTHPDLSSRGRWQKGQGLWRRLRRQRILIVAAILGVAAGGARAEDWTHYAGQASRVAIARRAPGTLDFIAWSAEPQSDEEFIGAASPIVCADRVLVLARVFDGAGLHVENRLIVYLAADGTRLWDAAIAADRSDGWSSPVGDVRNGTVIVASDTEVRSLDIHTGDAVWQLELERPVVNASPAVSSDLERNGVPVNRAFVAEFGDAGRPGKLYGINVDPFDLANNQYLPGMVAWTAETSGLGGGSPAYADGRVFIATEAGDVMAFDALARGTVTAPLWTTHASNDGFFGGVAVRDGFVYAANYNFWGAQNNSRLFKISAADGQIIWETPCERTDSIPIVTSTGNVFLSGGIAGFESAVKIQAFRDLGTSGELLWDTHVGTGGALRVGGWTHQPLLSGSYLYAGEPPDPFGFFGLYRSLRILDTSRDPRDPLFIVSHHVGSGGTPAADADRLYSIGEDGLFAFSIGANSSSGPNGGSTPNTPDPEGGNGR